MSSVLIQKEGGEFHSVNGFTAWQGFSERGYEIQYSNWEQMSAEAIPVEAQRIVVGSVMFVRRALRRLGIEPRPLDYPVRLQPYLGRRIWRTTWAEVRSRVDHPGTPVFVKPYDQDKAFTGYVVSAFRDLIRTARWPGEMPLWASDPFPFLSEWRYFVRDHAVIGVGHYKGDPFLHPDPTIVKAAIADFADEAPIAYGIDFGVTERGGTNLVEVNEGFSLGCLGLGPLAYSGFLEARWRELVSAVDA